MTTDVPTESSRAEPLYFGSPARPRFGWLHAASALAPPRAEGLVLCNPFGSEELSAHRSLRHFAAATAALGVPSLRFDYDGTGDSAGTDRDPGRLAAWVASVHDAIDELRRQTGVERVHVLGLRIGAALAALAAVDRTDVAGCIAVVPVVSGRQWLREADALQVALRADGPPVGGNSEVGPQESLGFVLTDETRASIAAIDLVALAKAPARDVLLITRADLSAGARLPERLRALGSNVDHRELPGYTDMMLDPHDAIVPEAMVRAVCEWLDVRIPRREPVSPGHALDPGGQATARVAADVNETAVSLDGVPRLFGILSAPAGGARPTRAVILLNSGANHRIGPNRLYVLLARRWAARGFLVLRVDVSGIGDSDPRPGERENVVYSRWAIQDVESFVRYLREQMGATACVAMGLCSGAYHALKAAVAGLPITGVVMINPLVFFWKEGMSVLPTHEVSQAAAQYRRSLLQPAKWKKLVSGQVDVVEFGRVVAQRVASVVGGIVHDVARMAGRPMDDDLGTELEALARREVSITFVFSAGDPGQDMLRVQAGSSLRRLTRDRQLRVHTIEGPNHTFTPIWSHEVMARMLDEEIGIK